MERAILGSLADVRNRRTGWKLNRELDPTIRVGEDLGFTGSENHVDHASSGEIVSPLFKLNDGSRAVLAPDDLDGSLGEQRALARSTAGCGHERDGDDVENSANPPTAHAASTFRESKVRSLAGHRMMYRIRMEEN